MKTITNSIKMLVLAFFLLGLKTANAQCSASFIYTQGANGNVTFTSTSILNNSISTVYYWTYGNGITTFTATGSAGMFPNYTYTANGNYTVTLFLLSTSPTCSTATSAVITVTNVNGGCALNANFTASSMGSGLYNFNNTSTGTVVGTTYSWAFGDGGTSTSVSPAHTYTANGNYVVTLTANNNFTTSCVSTKTLNINVNSNCVLTAGFNYSLNANGSVNFYNATTPSVGVSYIWSLGNTATTTAMNPAYTYTANGSYTVTLSASSSTPACASNITAVITITNVTGCNLTANFTASQGSNGLVNFNNTSTGTVTGMTYNWSFGNGSTSTSNSPSNTYTANGVYLVTLNASTNGTPACNSTKTLNITVNSICSLAAGFTYTAGANGSVQFGNTTTGTSGSLTSYVWNFGNSSNSNQANPTTTFANGTYTVTLTATNFSNCTSSTSQTISITNNTCVANANFTLLPTNTPKFWNAVPASTANITAAVWSWGDGSTSNTLFTSHLYSVSATYTICLSVTVSCGASATYCNSYFIYKPSGGSATDEEIIRIDVTPEALTTGLSASTIETAKVSVYPNPSKGEFKLSANGLSNEEFSKVSVLNLIGEVIYVSDTKTTNGTLNAELNLGAISNGVYFIKIESGNKQVLQKLVVNK